MILGALVIFLAGCFLTAWVVGVFVCALITLAGSRAAVSLLVIPTLASTTAGLVYLLVFGVGTIAGMTLLTAVLAYPVSVAARRQHARLAVAVTAGLASIVVGVVYAARVV